MRTPEQEMQAAIQRRKEEQDPSFTRFAAGGNFAAERAEATKDQDIPANLLGSLGLDQITAGAMRGQQTPYGAINRQSGFPMELEQPTADFHPELDPKAPREHTAFLVHITVEDWDEEKDEPFTYEDTFMVVLPKSDIAAAAELAKQLIDPTDKIDSITELPTAVYVAIPTDA